MKRSIAVASLAILAVAALAAPANAQQCATSSHGFNGQYNGSFNTGFNGGYNTGFNGGYNTGFNGGYNTGFNGAAYNGYNHGRFGNAFGFGGNIDNTQDRLQSRIQGGIASGRLTPNEAARLQAKFNQIANLEAQLRASGNRLSFGERQRLNFELANLNQSVSYELNDRNTTRHIGWNRY